MPHTDLATGILVFLPFVVALADWTAVTLPGKEALRRLVRVGGMPCPVRVHLEQDRGAKWANAG